MAMNILIIGSGGREHAIGWKLKQSKNCKKLFFAPGNGGTATLGKNLEINADTVTTKVVDEIDYFCRHNDIEMVVIGPEDPLAGGLADRLAAEGRIIFGPCQAAAKLEGDKAYAKHLMKAASIPTADAQIFDHYDKAMAYVQNRETPVVVKAAGLAKGKGVIVCSTQQEAIDAVESVMGDKTFGQAGATCVIEERLVGQEVSVLAFVDGRNIHVLDPAQDHKQAYEGDQGPNTGGMGAYTPTPLLTEKKLSQINATVLVPIVDAMRRDGVEFKGLLYAGLMLTAGGPKVLEFNVRFGDPECQPLLMRMKTDLVEVFKAVAEGTLDRVPIAWDKRCSCCVVICSENYPGTPTKGVEIIGIEKAEEDKDVKVFQAGTKRLSNGTLVTNGGRVLGVTAFGKDLKEAQQRANAACEKIQIKGSHYRKDIGYRVMS